MKYIAVQQHIQTCVESAIESAMADGALPRVDVPLFTSQPCKNPSHGDFYVSIAMQLAPLMNMPATKVADIIHRSIKQNHRVFDTIYMVAPGFINFMLSSRWIFDELSWIDTLGAEYGRWKLPSGGLFHQLEYGSVNPTGDISVVNGRAIVIGDCLKRLSAAAGVMAFSRYYVNDSIYSTQVDLFIESVMHYFRLAHGEESTLPDEGYKGDYVETVAKQLYSAIEMELYGYERTMAEAAVIAERFAKIAKKVTVNAEAEPTAEQRKQNIRKLIMDHMVNQQVSTLKRLNVRYDWMDRESEVVTLQSLELVLASLMQGGHVYMAVQRHGDERPPIDDLPKAWLATSKYGDAFDRCLVRGDGRPTYFFSDLAYNLYKARHCTYEEDLLGKRSKLVTILGADHSDYVKRMTAGLEMLDVSADPEYIIVQFTSLVNGDNKVTGGKRDGNFVPLNALIDEIGVDAARWHYLRDTASNMATINVDLAKAATMDNPVYYVQYTHARLCSVLANAAKEGIVVEDTVNFLRLDLLAAPAETALVKVMAHFPMVTLRAFHERAPHLVRLYCEELAQTINRWYELHRVLPIESEDLSYARAFLALQARTVLQNALHLVGVTAPPEMKWTVPQEPS